MENEADCEEKGPAGGRSWLFGSILFLPKEVQELEGKKAGDSSCEELGTL